MKKFILLLGYLILSSSVIAEEFPTGFWGIDFGAKKEDVIRIMSQKEGVEFAGDIDGSLIYEGGKWAGKSISALYFEFYEGMMITATVILEPSSERYVLTLFDDIVAKLNQKYYATKKIIKEFKPPFKAGDGYETLAIESDKTLFYAIWEFNYSQIIVNVLKSMNVVVRYIDIVGKELLDKAEAEKNILDM